MLSYCQTLKSLKDKRSIISIGGKFKNEHKLKRLKSYNFIRLHEKKNIERTLSMNIKRFIWS